MDALITNLSTEPVFIPGPNLGLDETGGTDDAQVWPDVTVADLDGNSQLKELVLTGTVSVFLSDDTRDAAVAAQGTLQNHGLPAYAFVSLPTGFEGRVALVTDGRKTGEGAGVGTGVPAYWSNGAWRVFFDDSAVLT
jgi:hypothetical protein